jgi:hypothetical protein
MKKELDVESVIGLKMHDHIEDDQKSKILVLKFDLLIYGSLLDNIASKLTYIGK